MYINNVYPMPAHLRPAARRARPAGESNSETTFAEEVEVVLSQDALDTVDPDRDRRKPNDKKQAKQDGTEQLDELALDAERERVRAQLSVLNEVEPEPVAVSGINITV